MKEKKLTRAQAQELMPRVLEALMPEGTTYEADVSGKGFVWRLPDYIVDQLKEFVDYPGEVYMDHLKAAVLEYMERNRKHYRIEVRHTDHPPHSFAYRAHSPAQAMRRFASELNLQVMETDEFNRVIGPRMKYEGFTVDTWKLSMIEQKDDPEGF